MRVLLALLVATQGGNLGAGTDPLFDPLHPDAMPSPHGNAEWKTSQQPSAAPKREQLRGAPAARSIPPGANCVGVVTKGRFSNKNCQESYETVQREESAHAAEQWCEAMFANGCAPPVTGATASIDSLAKQLGAALQQKQNATVAKLLPQVVLLGEAKAAEVVYR